MSDREEKKPRLEKMVDASEYKQKDTLINKLIKAFQIIYMILKIILSVRS